MLCYNQLKNFAFKVLSILLLVLIPSINLNLAQDVQVTLVDTFFTVTDKNGHFVGNLQKNDFIVLDNGVEQEIAKFGTRLGSALSLALVIDRSQSVGNKFPQEQQAAINFLHSVIDPRRDRGLVVAFDSKVYLIQDWINDLTSLSNAINKLSVAGGTSLFDAIYKTCRDKFTFDDHRKKILMLLTDGEDTTSRATFKQALEVAQLSGVAIYVVGIKAQESLNIREQQGKHVLQMIADMTGGRVFYPKGSESLVSLFGRLENEFRNQYNIGYYLNASLDGGFHQIKIESKDKSLTVNSRKGYYASRPPEEVAQ